MFLIKYIKKVLFPFYSFLKEVIYNLKHWNQPRLLFIGDSHAWVFEYIKQNNLLPEFNIKVITVNGATAQGMLNPNSKSNALKIFRKKIKKYPYRGIFVQLGEIDCGFLIWHRAQKYEESVDFQMERSLSNYFKFVDWLYKERCQNIILTGAILPTIKNNQDWGEIAWLRRFIKSTQRERTDLTFEYNSRLQKYTKNKKIGYIEITKEILNKNTNLVSDFYLSEKKIDHHLSVQKTASLWIKEIRDYLKYDNK